jgi:hypothetical protein
LKVRRVVTAHDQTGKSVVKSDERLERRYKSLAGFANTLLWATDGVPRVGAGWGEDPVPSAGTYLPSAGTTRLMTMTLPPDAAMESTDFRPEAYAEEMARLSPGFEQVFDNTVPGMHRTDTVDYGVLLDGEVWLELDTGEALKIKSGEVVVQQGTRHAWRNKSSRSATLLFVMIGAVRTA